MARGNIAQQVSGMMSNPYPRAREQVPQKTHCELCDRVIKTCDWPAHKTSKKHRAKEDAERLAAAPKSDIHGSFEGGNTFEGGSTFNDFNATPASGDLGGAGDGAWDSNANVNTNPVSAGDDGWGSNAIFNTSSGNAMGDSNDRVCFNCHQPGHQKRDCPTGSNNACFNCGEVGHRKTECTNPRKHMGGGGGDRLCFNCNQPGHNKSECPEKAAPRAGGSGRPCFNCGEEGHMSKDCEKPKVPFCRNCDGRDHFARDCPNPKDWSRVKCHNCQGFGHTASRCKEPPADETTGGSWGDGTQAQAQAPTGGWATQDSSAADGSWDNAGETPAW